MAQLHHNTRCPHCNNAALTLTSVYASRVCSMLQDTIEDGIYKIVNACITRRNYIILTADGHCAAWSDSPGRLPLNGLWNVRRLDNGRYFICAFQHGGYASSTSSCNKGSPVVVQPNPNDWLIKQTRASRVEFIICHVEKLLCWGLAGDAIGIPIVMRYPENALGNQWFFEKYEGDISTLALSNIDPPTQRVHEINESSHTVRMYNDPLLQLAIPEAGYDNQERCLAGTRQEIVSNILRWTEDGSSHPICWLSGLAGSGKSAVAHEVAAQLDNANRLLASFFFRRGKGQRSNSLRLITTLAYQLTVSMPTTKPLVQEVLKYHPTIMNQPLRTQFEKLLVDVIRLKRPSSPGALIRHPLEVIVIDALDECYDGHSIEDFIRTLPDIIQNCQMPFRLFFTGRTEKHVCEGFALCSPIMHHLSLEDFNAHDDILALFRYEFTRILGENGLQMEGIPISWPSDSDLEPLVKKSSGLFIYASTLIKFIQTTGQPHVEVQKLLNTHNATGPQFGRVSMTASRDVHATIETQNQTTLTGFNDAPPLDDGWEAWWEENTQDIAALLKKHPDFDARSRVECAMLACSVKIYQRLVVYVYVQIKVRHTTPERMSSLRDTLSKWKAWNDLQWLTQHHIVRKTLWDELNDGGIRADDRLCNLQRILDFDMDAIQRRVITVLNNRQVKNVFLNLCQSDPTPMANLLQTLIDRDNLPPETQAKLVRTLARLAKSSRCYPDCLILTPIRRTGTDPVAGGGFADVWKGYFTEQPVALKALRIYKHSLREKALKEFSHEAVIWRQLKHPNILPFYGVFTGDEHFDRLCLVSPWMDSGNIIDFLDVHPNSDRLLMLSDIAQGLEYLHLFQPPIIHGDLKGANIFVSPSLSACLGDFGIARFRDSLESSTLGATTGNSTGTLRWQPPELLNTVGGGESLRRSEKCDIYSFGCVCLELMTGRPPFAEIQIDGAVMMAIANGQTPQRPLEYTLELGLNDKLWNLMQQCWTFDPALRPQIVQLVDHFKLHRRESDLATETNENESPIPRASLDQYGFPHHYVSMSSVTSWSESWNNCIIS